MKIRKLAIPVPLIIAVQKTSRHKLNEAPFYMMVDISVPVFDNADAPVAVEYDAFGAPDGRMHVRTTGDSFLKGVDFQPFELNPPRRLDPIFMTEEMFAERLARAEWQSIDLLPSDGGFLGSHFRRGELVEFEPDQLFNYDRATLTDLVSTVQENARNLSIVDGILYRRTSEPYYKVHGPTPEMPNPGASIVYAGQSKDKSVSNEFALSCFDEASDYAERLYGQPLRLTEAANVFIPEVFTLDRTKQAVLELLDKALDEHAPDLASADLDTMLAWGQLRDAVLRAERSGEATAVDDVFEGPADRYKNSPGAKSRASALLTQAYDRWSLRPVPSHSIPSAGSR